MNPLTISLFGGLQVLPPGAERPLPLAPSARALLAFLLVQQHPVSRDVLMDVFWMETPPEQARSNLASAVYRLRQQLEADPVTPGTYLLSRRSGEVGFNWDSPHWLDSQTFTASVRPLLRKPIPDLSEADVRILEDALTLYRGDLLEGIYDDWALREREHYRSLYLHCLNRLLHYYAGRGGYRQSVLYAQEILRKEPLHEESHRELMRLYEAVGQPEQALRHYAHLCDLLRREMDQPPLAETAAVAHEINARTHLRITSPTSGPAPELARLLQELEIAKQNLAEASRLLESISQAAATLAGGGDGPVTGR